MTVSPNQQTMFTTATLYTKTPKSIGAAVVKALDSLGMFAEPGKRVQREDVLTRACYWHSVANGGKTRAEQETLGRELRRRGAGAGRQQAADRLWGIGWNVCADDGSVWVEAVK